MAKIEVAEVKTYRCSDGKVFDSREMAEAHEIELKDPNYAIVKRFEELEKKFLELQGELLKLSARLECVESPWGKLNKKQPFIGGPYGNPGDCNPFLPCNGKLWYGTGQNISEAIKNLKEVKE